MYNILGSCPCVATGAETLSRVTCLADHHAWKKQWNAWTKHLEFGFTIAVVDGSSPYFLGVEIYAHKIYNIIHASLVFTTQMLSST
jgi:surfactin synthase thioesterase subunit